MGAVQTRRGRYKIITASPWVYTRQRGGVFRFTSQKKMEIFIRKYNEREGRLDAFLNREGLVDLIPADLRVNLSSLVEESVYKEVQH